MCPLASSYNRLSIPAASTTYPSRICVRTTSSVGRRLLISIEASIYRELQWVPFKPNAEPPGSRVRRSMTNFLTLLWRYRGLGGRRECGLQLTFANR
jgi:hypothetical protein